VIPVPSGSAAPIASTTLSTLGMDEAEDTRRCVPLWHPKQSASRCKADIACVEATLKRKLQLLWHPALSGTLTLPLRLCRNTELNRLCPNRSRFHSDQALRVSRFAELRCTISSLTSWPIQLVISLPHRLNPRHTVIVSPNSSPTCS
jgi:hypothetical protein